MKTILCSFLTIAFLLTFSLSTTAQDSTATYKANPEDVKSLDTIVEALYGVISGDKGVARDWQRFLSLFTPGAQLIPSGPDQEGNINARYMSPGEYVERFGSRLEETGFFEIEVARKEQHFGSMTQIWSTYESRGKADDPQPYARGINSIQLINDGNRWWIVNIYWTAEREGLEIPKEYLPK